MPSTIFFSKTIFFIITFCFIIICLFVYTSNAKTLEVTKGNVTGLPIPRFVSIKSNKVNVRRGPNSTYQIDWVYTRAGVPLKVTAEYENWRRIEDFQGEGGWVHSRLLSGKRFVIFVENKSILKRRPNRESPAVAIVEKGVIARLVSSMGEWSEIFIEGHYGWILNESVWGTLIEKE